MRIVQRLLIATLGVVLFTTAAVRPASAQASQDKMGWLGVYTQNLTSELREGINYNGNGVLINRVIDNSPAAQAGLEEGDVITTVGGRTVRSPGDLADLIQQRRPGSRVVFRLVRDGRTRTVNVRIGERPSGDGDEFTWRGSEGDEKDGMTWYRSEGDEKTDRRGGNQHGDEPHIFRFDGDQLQIPDISGMFSRLGRGRLGVRVESLNDDLAGYFQVPDGRGVLILEVMSDTPAEKAGLEAGDVIREVAGKRVDDADDLVSELRAHDEGSVRLSIVRNGSRRSIEAQLDKATRAFGFGNRDGGNFNFRFDDRGRDRTRDEQRRNRDQLRERSREQGQDLRDELQQLRQELRDLKRELRQLRDEG